MTETDLRYPVGKFQFPDAVSAAEKDRYVREISEVPRRLRNAVSGLEAEQLETPYRPGGWTVRQVVHHLPDSHMTSYLRFKLAVTEDEPAVKGYDEARWADLVDARTGPVEYSLALLEGLHERWVLFLDSLSPAECARRFVHSQLGPVRVDQNIALYAWHGRHHVAQIEALREREGWR